MDVSAYEALGRTQLFLRWKILKLGIDYFRGQLDKIHPDNREWLEREIASLERERDEIGVLWSRKFREDVETAIDALAAGPEAVDELLQSQSR